VTIGKQYTPERSAIEGLTPHARDDDLGWQNPEFSMWAEVGLDVVWGSEEPGDGDSRAREGTESIFLDADSCGTSHSRGNTFVCP